RAKRRAHDSRLGNRCVDDAFSAKAVYEALGDFERASINADVFAQTEHGGIAFHLFPDSLTNGFEITELGHGQEVYYGRRFRLLSAQRAKIHVGKSAASERACRFLLGTLIV